MSKAANPRPARTPDFVLTVGELRAVSAFNVACVDTVIGLFEQAHPADARPRAALDAARAFVNGEPRSMKQRSTALAAHRAAKEAEPSAAQVAMAAGDAAASAYLHPLADAAQVGHILRGPAYSVLALQHRAVDPLTRPAAIDIILRFGTPQVIDVLRRYPRLTRRHREIASVMSELDARLRTDPFS